jgi:hypothetical protein
MFIKGRVLRNLHPRAPEGPRVGRRAPPMCIRHVTLMYMQPGYFVRQIRWQKGGTGKDRRALCNLVWSGGCEAAMSQSVEFEPYECCLCAGVMALIQGALCVLMFMARFRARLVVGRALSSPCCRQGFELACFGLMSNLCYGHKHGKATRRPFSKEGGLFQEHVRAFLEPQSVHRTPRSR